MDHQAQWRLAQRLQRHVKWKLALCVQLARECSRNSWQCDAKQKSEWLRIKRESMADAREWREG